MIIEVWALKFLNIIILKVRRWYVCVCGWKGIEGIKKKNYSREETKSIQKRRHGIDWFIYLKNLIFFLFVYKQFLNYQIYVLRNVEGVEKKSTSRIKKQYFFSCIYKFKTFVQKSHSTSNIQYLKSDVNRFKLSFVFFFIWQKTNVLRF